MRLQSLTKVVSISVFILAALFQNCAAAEVERPPASTIDFSNVLNPDIKLLNSAKMDVVKSEKLNATVTASAKAISAVNKGCKIEKLSEELKLMVATVYGEAANCSDAAKEAVANTIMNRVGKREWKNFSTVTDVIKNSGFDAYTYRNIPYKTAMDYLNNRDGSNWDIECTIKIVSAVYKNKKKDNSKGAILYYSPNALAILHQQFPKKYPLTPAWLNNRIQEVKVCGAEKDDLKFYRYS